MTSPVNAPANIHWPDAWPAELRLLVVHLRMALGTATAADQELSRQPVDWDTWLRWVERHRVGSFLFRRLPPSAQARLPEAVARKLRDIGVHNAQRALARTGELLRLAAQLERDGLRVIAFKGPVLSQDLYGDAGVRSAGDLDLLVSPADTLKASAVLQSAGYQRTYPDFELTALQWRKYLRLQHELNHHHPQRGITVELQWRLEGLALEFEDLWRARGSLGLAGQSLATLPWEANALFLFAHGARHGWSSLFWLLDVALVLQADKSSSARGLWSTAQRMQVTKPLMQGVALANQLLGVALPEGLAGQLEREGGNGGLVAEALRRISRPDTQQRSTGDVFRDTLYSFRLQETWRGKLSLVQPRLLSPQNWKLWRLPDRWFWLYYPASPALWVWRRLRGGNSSK